MNRNNPLSALESWRSALAQVRWRVPVLLTGTPEQTLADVVEWQVQSGADVLWLSERAPQGAWTLPAGKANHELGREADAVVVDLYSGLAVDAVAALAGSVRAGGWLLLLAPELQQWGDFADPEYQRLTVEPFGPAGTRRMFLARSARLWGSDARVIRAGSGEALPVLPAVAAEPSCADQQAVVQAILCQYQSRQRRPLVVQADRGRGKSAALGMAAAQLLQQGLTVRVTAPRPQAAETLLRFAGDHPVNPVRFIAPDLLLQTLPPADVLMVDEAAALAPSLLLPLLQHYRCVVLATTVQGYEGTGQGFVLRFARQLDQQFPGWSLLTLEQPMRWADGDPLEGFINDWLLLNACCETPAPPGNGNDGLTLRDITPTLHGLDENLLRSVHGLLVAAHYRTRPSDFRTLLDGPNVRTWVVQHQNQVVAVAMIATEGNLPEPLCDAIAAGRRRPHGHVLAQSLAVHLNVTNALRETSWRVVRIAVHSQWQRRGVGRWLLQQLEQAAQSESVALLGSVFAASDDVLAFWQGCGFDVVRVGITRESTSAAFPVMVIRPVTAAGSALAQTARQRFEHTFLHSLADTPEPLPASLIVTAWQRAQCLHDSALDDADRTDLQQFLAGVKTYENAAATLHRAVLQWMAQGRLLTLPAQQQVLVIGRILQKQPWPALIARDGYSGQKQIRAALRDAIAVLAAG